MNNNKKKQELCRKIRILAGQLGEIYHPEPEEMLDAEHYDFQVMVGLATATVEISDFDPEKLFDLLEYCLIRLDLYDNPRISALKDALEHEVTSRFYEEIEKEEREQERGE